MRRLIDGSNPVAEASVIATATAGIGGGSTTSVVGWFTGNEMLAALGVLIAVLGFVVNFVFQFRRDQREGELHSKRIAAMMLHDLEKEEGNF